VARPEGCRLIVSGWGYSPRPPTVLVTPWARPPAAVLPVLPVPLPESVPVPPVPAAEDADAEPLPELVLSTETGALTELGS